MRDHEALIAFLEARMRAPFAWGKNTHRRRAHEDGNSCVHLAAGAVFVQTGRSVLRDLPGWTSERGAIRALGRVGGLEAATDLVLRRIAPAMAHRGDIGLVENIGGRPSLVVIEGQLVAGPGPAGLVRLPRVAVKAAWSVDV